ncbi:hypothetical protein HY948_05120 [Candidatus Gottesmanbacteria bacterium]|nr:hypothetical protein [Candidatus Gottesmanbacteria bacterium]
MNPYYPKINFVLDKEHDRDTIKMFEFSESALGSTLAFINKPEFDGIRVALASAFLDDFYKKFGKEMADDLQNTKVRWDKVGGYFFKEVDKIFGNYPWPAGDYTGYISVWRRNPRWISGRAFNFSFVRSWIKNPPNPVKTIAHEMLHFVTYDYLDSTYANNTKPRVFVQYYGCP